ncbi:MAG: hypothetical protein A2748_00560 [Candidatus Wildermuthbacteria bacterium RIFCSPHIGHO2_01_FULL_45_20]|uniref:DUF8173 domain-containing protein n=1 Tax=Candidatus Wildermuthbacteria bacterium RIFCSPHIGHO2_02_FULL_45_25 TaxID=1802450 RepID=A0A1G2R5Z6_9BACT|nr:MAG: hypothetical protein A2748_00560 [Candidatus Wildermuthbacteria bacterium RIFCSPHIGHO2_01_FULL_45_20]OHA67672.1 MAG: hypothetical protein A3C04_02020 [Candidatus Wildermuthbacteria bacterium RIFCSPHIGHO2_02_FULL_45_25]
MCSRFLSSIVRQKEKGIINAMRIFLWITGFIIASSCFGGAFVFANQDGGAGRRVVEAGQLYEGDYAAVGEAVEIAGMVDGDVYAAGGQVIVSGIITGDLIAAGGMVTISGTVQNNVRALAGQFILSGTVGRNLTVAAMNIDATNSSAVGRNVITAGGNMTLEGSVFGNIKTGGRSLTIAGPVGGAIEAAVDTIRFTHGASVQKDITYWSKNSASIANPSGLGGIVSQYEPLGAQSIVQWLGWSGWSMWQPIVAAIHFLTTLVLGFVVTRFFPGFSQRSIEALSHRKWQVFRKGISALLIIPIVAGLLILTIVGIPLGVILLTLSSLILYTARILVMMWIGVVLFDLARIRWQVPLYGKFIAGLLVFSLLASVPVMGWALSFFAVLFGLGAARLAIKSSS